MFSVQIAQGAVGVVWVLRGELDFHSVVHLHEASERELAPGRKAAPVVIDCGALTFCDSTGISAMVRLHQDLAAQERALRLAAVPDALAQLFSVTGLDQLFAVYTDVNAALNMGSIRRGMVSGDLDGWVREGQGT
ncbi:STAS domain-containing protein [Streptomyces sp. NPDC005244]|uniref:STAS domain-containing protein n=1 Tax=Streptomyces sp. NPDC005244 TaxID=3364708 RepID=UPI0036886A32